jgi:hypothetical protein
MQILAKCAKCGASLPTAPLTPLRQSPAAAAGADPSRPVGRSAQRPRRRSLSVCRGGDFYVRKDFDPKMGVAAVALAALSRGLH